VALAEDALLVLDAVTGSERHRIASALHLVPDADRCTGVAALRGDVVRSAAPWHPRWGETLAAVRLRVTAETELPWFGGWLLRLGEPAPATPEVIVERHPPGLRVHLREAGRLGLAIEWTVGRGDADRLAVQPLPLGG
jgi:hypothetical protein